MNEPFPRRTTWLVYAATVLACIVLMTVYLVLHGHIAVDLNQMR